MAQSMAHHSRRRDKPTLSCTFCRGRKLRCDRQSPCSACVTRGKAADCTFTVSEQERKDAIDYRPHSHARSPRARQSLARLESFVTHMRDRDTAGPSGILDRPGELSAARDNSDTGDGMEKLDLKDDHEIYTGSSHWVTILEDIQHLKDELPEDNGDMNTGLEPTLSDPVPVHRVTLLNSALPPSKEQILAQVPSRKVVDRHVSRFFNSFDMGPFLIHRNAFLSEYASFWGDPSSTPTMWIALLFSIMSMSALLHQQDMTTSEPQDMLETYRTLTIHCLLAADYLQPSKYTIETLILHFGVDQNVNFDTPTGNWVTIGIIIRLALRMGLHRDPSHWPNIRPLQAELRRRLWMTLYQMDFFTSTQVGLPRVIKDSQCDTRAPAHLFDHDIGPGDLEMPPERRLADPTPLLYIILRNTVIKVAAEIYDATEAGPPSPSVMTLLDTKLQRAIDAIPAWLKYGSNETSVADNPVTIHQQMSIDILIHKAVYLLHRRSFVKATDEAESRTSNELCIKAALAILEHQRRISEETQPGGLMFGIRWKMATSLNQEFLQATMMLCFALSRLKDSSGQTAQSCAHQRRDDIIEALVAAKALWERDTDKSVEAQRAAKVITMVLQQDQKRSTEPTPAAASGEVFDPFLGIQGDDFLAGFDYGQTMTLDPSFFTINEDVPGFGTMLDDFATDYSL